MQFSLSSKFKPTGDQPEAIKQLVANIEKDNPSQVLLGVTGSGKTFTMANVIAQTKLPTLVISHNKTLAGQLYQEFRDFFPKNGVSYFVSYYDYYQPEAYIPTTDTYIEKETDINDEIEKLRLLATTNLQTRDDVIVVASVSCIYNLGDPQEYAHFAITIKLGEELPREQFLKNLVRLQYERSDYESRRGSFRVKGDTVELWPAYTDELLRLEFLGNKLEKLAWVDPISGQKIKNETDWGITDSVKAGLTEYMIFPAKHYLTDPERQKPAMEQIRTDLKSRIKELKSQGKLVEAMRLDQKVNYDLDMITELGFVNGIENYSRYFDNRKPGEPPYTLLDFFRQKKNWLLIIDESHMTVPQIRGMYNGDQARKQTLIDYGFRLPSALDNRPLQFNEFLGKIPQTVYVSATPADWELERSKGMIVEQLIRPTGLVDPEVEVRPTQNQIQDLTKEILKRKIKGQRVLVTTLTKKLAEALTDYLNEEEHISSAAEELDISLSEQKLKVAYLHSDVDTLDRQDILDDLRKGEYDVLIGINLLREGLDLPEVSLVAILDADKEGFLRSRTSLIQTMGRAARHIDGQIIMYGDVVTGSMQAAIDEVKRRRQIQIAYNQKHGITPTSIQKEIREKLIERELKEQVKKRDQVVRLTPKGEEVEITQIKKDDFTPEDINLLVKRLRKAMLASARDLDFEKAAKIRDKIRELQN
ncbi:excinuclease ABC subunit B [Candidatus Beckwithbacteria bacterium]|nr:excinuclease ABC subunit B [Candidatus Beckwithbacteria bacterium]